MGDALDATKPLTLWTSAYSVDAVHVLARRSMNGSEISIVRPSAQRMRIGMLVLVGAAVQHVFDFCASRIGTCRKGFSPMSLRQHFHRRTCATTHTMPDTLTCLRSAYSESELVLCSCMLQLKTVRHSLRSRFRQCSPVARHAGVAGILTSWSKHATSTINRFLARVSHGNLCIWATLGDLGPS